MPFFYDFHVAVLHSELEHSDTVVTHELSGYCTADQCGKFLLAVGDILVCLYDAMLVFSALCLNGHDELTTMSIYADIHLIDFDLTYFF
ncbi:hypothetical protein D3C72_1634610 [compost metagenome]